MNKVDIYLENRKLDIDYIDLALTYSFSDLTNPTSVTGDYSKTITIKGNQTNNEIFGQIWRFDRTILDSATSNIGVNFNPSKRVDCKIYINGGIFKSGYVKLNSIKMSKGVISYDITFYSDLCGALHALKDKKLIDLDYPNNLEHIINRNTIIDMWNNKHELSDSMTYIMANNGLYDKKFESNKILTYVNNNYKIVDTPSQIKIDECAKGEYRSYYQRPALKIDNLLNKIVDSYNQENDNKIELGKEFFNINNPYYASSVITLPQLNIEEKTNVYKGFISQDWQRVDSSYKIKLKNGEESLSSTPYNVPVDQPHIILNNIEPYTVSDSSIFNNTQVIDMTTLGGSSEFVIEFLLEAILTLDGKLDVGAKIEYYRNNYPTFGIDVQLWENGKLVEHMQPFYYDIKGNKNYDSSVSLDRPDGYALCSGGRDNESWAKCYSINRFTGYGDSNFLQELPVHFKSTYLPKTGQYEIRIYPYLIQIGNNVWGYYYQKENYGFIGTKSVEIVIHPFKRPTSDADNILLLYPANGINGQNPFTGVDFTVNNNEEITSDSRVLKNDLLDGETTQGDILIDYCKMFGLIFDTEGNKVRITNKNNFFSNYQIIDWNDKIDYSKDINIIPLSFDSKYLLLQYKDNESYYSKYYKNKYNQEYGIARIDTNYEFNSDDKNLIEGTFDGTIMSKEATRMLIGNDYIFKLDEKILPAYFTLDNNERNSISTSFNLLFNNGIKNINSPIWVSDSSIIMKDENIGGGNACWLDLTNTTITNNFATQISYYPQFSTLSNNGLYSWSFGYPRENYAGWSPSEYPETSTIYSNFWKNYINEIYNVDNKVVKCYVKLTPNDMCQFSFKNFIKAFDCLWHVNKINNYNPLSDTPTEVEMIKVTNIDAYVNGQKEFSIAYSITQKLISTTSSNSATTIWVGETYETTLTPISDETTEWKLSSVTVTMDGIDITNKVFDKKTHTITIPNVSGNIIITAISTDNIVVCPEDNMCPEDYVCDEDICGEDNVCNDDEIMSY